MGVKTFLWSELENKQWRGQVCSKNIKANFIACELSLRELLHLAWYLIVTNDLSISFLRFAELPIGSSIKYKITLSKLFSQIR